MKSFFIFEILFIGALYLFVSYSLHQGGVVVPHNVSKDLRTYERYANNHVRNVSWKDSDDRMALIEPRPGRFQPYYIDVYESTIAHRRAWSVAGNVPTTKLLFKEAQEACKNAGKYLCRKAEWQVACRGGRTQPYFYKNTRKLAQYCDFARSRGYDKTDYVNKNNSHPRCVTGQGVHHMIGNVTEMTEGPNGKAVVMGMTYYDQHYRDPNNALRQSCEHVVHKEGVYPENRHNEGMGFRCCKTVSQ